MNNNIHHLPKTAPFDEFWEWYPHHPTRSKKAASRELFTAITTEGLATRTRNKDSGGYINLHLKATPEEIVEGAKRYNDSFPVKGGGGTDHYKRDTAYVEGAQVWLNGGRWED